MKNGFKNILMAIGIICFTHSITQASTMKLLYDGREHEYHLPPINIYIDNEPLKTSTMPAVQIDDRVLVPAKEVFEALGATVEWKENEKSIYIHNEFSLIVLKVNNKEAWIDGQTRELDIAPKIINDKIMIPLRLISEYLGFNILWQNDTRKVYISHIDMMQELLSPEIPEIPSVSKDIVEGKEEQEGEFLKGITYDYEREELVLEKPSFLMLSDIIETDEYRQRRLIIDLKDNYSDSFPDGILRAEGGVIKQLTVQTDSSTKIIIETHTIQALNIYEENQKIHIKLVTPRQKYEKIIVIDPGHGGTAPGTSGGGILEKDNTLKYGKAFHNLLDNDPDIKVYSIREEDVTVSLEERAQIANEINPDLFISIHNNAVEGNNEVKERVKGTETYYFDNPDDLRGKTFAAIVQEGIVKTFNMTDRKIKADKGFVVLKNTTMPGVLIEVGFLSNTEDREKMTQSDFAYHLAEVLYQAVLTYFKESSRL